MNALIIEDQYSIADAVKAMLEKEGFSAVIATDGSKGEEEALSGVYDIIILDVMLPNKNGFEILRAITNEVKTPVIMVTAKGEIDDKLNGLEIGADDYITKPFHIRELLARVNTVLKRANKLNTVNMPSYGDITLDLKNQHMICGSKKLSLTTKESRLLELMLINGGNVITREQILLKIWGYFSDAEYNNVEVYISFLRKKLRLLQSSVRIITIRNIGYRLEVKDDKEA